jgi:hypothetical protein
MNVLSKIFNRKQTTEDKLNIIKSYFREVHLTSDSVGFWLLLCNIDTDHGMRAHGGSTDAVVTEIYERLHFKMSFRAQLLSSAKHKP